MKKLSIIKKLFMLSQIININNILQMVYLSNKELVNEYAIWESSSTILLCFYFIALSYHTVIGDKCIGTYMKKKARFWFYGDIIIKFCSAELAIAYILLLKGVLKCSVWYIVQVLLILIDIIIIIYLYREIRTICNSDSKELINYNKVTREIKCTIEEKELVEKYYSKGTWLIVLNFSYNFILTIENVIWLPMGIFILNIVAILKYYNDSEEMLSYMNGIEKKHVLRAMIYLLISNLANIYVYMSEVSLGKKGWFLFIFDFFVGICVELQLLNRIAKVIIGMKSYHRER